MAETRGPIGDTSSYGSIRGREVLYPNCQGSERLLAVATTTFAQRLRIVRRYACPPLGVPPLEGACPAGLAGRPPMPRTALCQPRPPRRCDSSRERTTGISPGDGLSLWTSLLNREHLSSSKRRTAVSGLQPAPVTGTCGREEAASIAALSTVTSSDPDTQVEDAYHWKYLTQGMSAWSSSEDCWG